MRTNDEKPETSENETGEEKPETSKDGTGEETREPTLEDMLNELPLSDQGKKLLAGVIGGVAANLNQISTRLETLEKQPASENPETYSGLSAEQKYNVLIAKASAPAAAAQQSLLQALVSRTGAGSGGDLSGLVKSAETIQGLRSVLFPAPTPLQMAMEKAQVAQVLAQTRLMNKVAGKATTDYLDKIEAEMESAGAGEGEE